MKFFRAVFLFLSGASLALLPGLSTAQETVGERQLITLDRPGDREFVRDLAHLIDNSDLEKIKTIGNRLLTEKATPIIVVTINSMADHGGAEMRIETFARLLFDQWGIGVAKLNGQDWNTGILLLVSKGDRKARIELGGYWRHEHDVQCQKIMEELIVPNFKNGNFSGGILAGVEALDKMARGLALPQGVAGTRSSTRSGGFPVWLTVIAVALGIFTVVSLIRSGSSGWSWLLWGAVFGLVGYLLYSFINNSGSSGDSGGGFSGGSFGGGFSGGGGSTGSW
jgi:uncharacterized protein